MNNVAERPDLPSWAVMRHGAVVCFECEADRGCASGTPTAVREALDAFLHNTDCSRTPQKSWQYR